MSLYDESSPLWQLVIEYARDAPQDEDGDVWRFVLVNFSWMELNEAIAGTSNLEQAIRNVYDYAVPRLEEHRRLQAEQAAAVEPDPPFFVVPRMRGKFPVPGAWSVWRQGADRPLHTYAVEEVACLVCAVLNEAEQYKA